MRFDEQTGTFLYAASSGGVAYKLPPGATSWVNITSNLPDSPISDILPDPANDIILFASTNAGVYLSPDGGNSWWLTDPIQGGILADDGAGQIFYVGGTHGGLSATFNLGSTWFDIETGMQNVFVGALATAANGASSALRWH